MAAVVAAKNTPISKEQALAALQKAWGVVMSRELARSLLSLIWIETAGTQAMKNFNPGNISASDQYSGMLWRPPWYPEPTSDTPQKYADLHKAMLNKTAPSGFRAYGSLEDGFRDFVNQLRHSFPEVVAAGEHGTPDQFRQALSQKYSHDYRNPQATATFEKLQAGFAPVVAHLPSGGSHRAGLAAVALTAAGLGAVYLARSTIKAVWGRFFG